jgi:O-antigen/teichoic acid export membrane protein
VSDRRLGYGGSVVVSVIAVAAISVLALGNSIVIARAVGPEGRGLYGLTVAIGALALPVASVGLGSATTWQLGREQPHAQLLSLARSVCLLSLALALVVAASCLGLFELGLEHATLWAVAAAALTLPAQVTVDIARGFLLGQRRAIAYNVSAAVVVAILLGLNVAAAVLRLPGHLWVLGNLIVANWVMALWMAVASLRSPSQRPEPALVRSSLSYGWRSGLVALGDAALLRVDYLVAAPFVELAAIGIYAIADQISHLMSWVGLMAGKMLLPEAASDGADGQRSLAKLALACRVILAAVVFGALVAIGLGRWLIELLFGPEFSDAYVGLLVLLPATACKSIHALVSTWLQGRGDQHPVVRASLVAVVVEVVAVAGLAFGFGWLGVAAAKTGAYAVQLTLSLIALRQHRARLPEFDGHVLPGGRWLLRPSDVRALNTALAERRARRAQARELAKTSASEDHTGS